MGRLQRGMASREIDCLFRDGVATGLTDKELLERFAASRDPGGELAFTTLVARHGPMVLNVCRRILRNPSDADDAFQAIFLVLVRRAGSIRFGNMLAPWLYGVSVRVARRVRVMGARRSPIAWDEDALESIPDRGSGVHSGLDLRLAIDDALALLPASFRAAIGLCYLEGLTHEEAADKLGCPVGTVRSRLARGRALLRGRLERSGLGPQADASNVASRPDGEAAPPIVAAHLMETTARAASRLAAGQPMAGIVPARLAGIVAGVTRSMMISKVATAAFVFVATGLAAWGVSAGLAGPQVPETRAASGPADAPASPSPLLTVAATQLPADAPKKAKVSRVDSDVKPDAELPADFPPFVVKTEPRLGEGGVDPALREIRVTFSKPMVDKGWSWTQGNVYAFPEVDGTIHYEKDMRTCVLPVKLKPGTTYVMGINGGRFHNFKDTGGRPALDYTLGFRTRAAR
jgi:RNA polymerase sigma factor (sigma-70 family)